MAMHSKYWVKFVFDWCTCSFVDVHEAKCSNSLIQGEITAVVLVRLEPIIELM